VGLGFAQFSRSKESFERLSTIFILERNILVELLDDL